MKPLLSELFLPCSGKHSPMRANRYPLTTITGAQRASGQTHSRARSHQDGADLRADRSTAYLVSCIRVRSAHGNSLDDLVGAGEQGRWNGNTNGPCGLKIDDQFELGRLDDRQVAGFFAFQHAAGVDTSLPISIWQTCPIAHQTAGIDEGFEWVNGRNRMMRGQHHETRHLAREKGIAADEQRAGSLAHERSKSHFDLVLGARLQNKNLPADDACRALRVSFLGLRFEHWTGLTGWQA